tara:strand:+ start:1012 stop:1191 length:180 start_codon:yes stop_codon:yes gene_type:complete
LGLGIFTDITFDLTGVEHSLYGWELESKLSQIGIEAHDLKWLYLCQLLEIAQFVEIEAN